MTPPAAGFVRAALHLGGLWALAFAQPLFELLGRSAQFFVARGSTTGDILVLALGYALVPPLLGAAAVWALGRIRPALGEALLLSLIALLVAALVLPPLGDALGGSAAAVAVALLAGAGAAALYRRAAAVRAFATVLSPAPLIVLLLFLVFSPVRELILPSDASGSVAGPSRSSTPIVHVVLDELPVTTLDRGDGTIDARRFPNLAALAETSTWYRNATTVDDLTTAAVPAQLTGELPERDSLPTANEHPRSLFTLFARSHDLIVVEPITELCPARLCSRSRPPPLERLRALRADLTVVAGHLLLPEDLRRDLPSVSEGWEDFDGGARERGIRGGSLLMRNVLDRLASDDAAAGFARAAAALERPRTRPPLVFVHSTLPHGPWRFLPDGREYPRNGKAYPGLEEIWTGPQWLVDQGFQRHVLQVQYTDRLVGRLLRTLRATGVFDDAVIVVTGDHGMSLTTGTPRRQVRPESVGEIAPVPFLVKLPGQKRGRVADGAVRTIDVLPTIAAAAGVRLPWRADGRPAGERRFDPAAPVAVTHSGAPVARTSLGAVLAARRAREEQERRLLRAGPYGFGPRPELLGRTVGASAPSGGGPRATLDAPGAYAAVEPRARVVPVFVTGAVTGLAPGAELAVAVDGRIEATTRVYAAGPRRLFAALVPPESLEGGATMAVQHIEPGGELRAIATTGGR